jgi:hypothetical protein
MVAKLIESARSRSSWASQGHRVYLKVDQEENPVCGHTNKPGRDIVSHSLVMLSKACDKAIVLRKAI